MRTTTPKTTQPPLLSLKVRWISAAVLSLIFVLNAAAIEGFAADLWVSLIANTLLFSLFWWISDHITAFLDRRLSWQTALLPKITLTAVLIVSTALGSLLSIELLEWSTHTGQWPTLKEALVNLMFGSLILSIMSAVHYALRLLQAAQQREVEQTEQKVEAYYRSLIEGTDDSILVLDSEGRVKFHSGGSAVPTPSKAHKSPLWWVHDDDRERMLEHLQSLQAYQNPIPPLVYRLQAPSASENTPEYVECTFVQAFDNPMIEGIITTHRNISQRVAHEKAKAQFESLKTQINPHFLFNSLNVLSSLVHVDPNLAEKFIDQLAHAYRYLLEQKENELVSLKTELDFVDAFKFLLLIRFEDKLAIDIRLPATLLSAKIAPLTLQLLIENAVKHNRLSTEEPLKIHIFANEDNELVVQNNLQLRNKEVPSTGLGLKNIQQRYALLSNRPTSFRIENDTYVAKIPLLS